jgi:hypothetical protein
MRLYFFFIVGALSCQQDSDCSTYSICRDGECQHKSLFPIGGAEVLGSFMILVASGLANAGGIGGGPLMVIILITIFSFDTYESVPLSQLIIFGGSLTAIIIKSLSKTPCKTKTFDRLRHSLVVKQSIVIRCQYWSHHKPYYPQWLILFIMTLILGYISIDSLFTAIKIYKKENSSKVSVKILCPDTGILNSYGELDPELKTIYDIEKKIVPPKSLINIGFIFLFVVLGSFIRGSKSFDSIIGLQFCSPWY